MNIVALDNFKRKANFNKTCNDVDLVLVHIESNYQFLSPYQITDSPKEREK